MIKRSSVLRSSCFRLQKNTDYLPILPFAIFESCGECRISLILVMHITAHHTLLTPHVGEALSLPPHQRSSVNHFSLFLIDMELYFLISRAS